MKLTIGKIWLGAACLLLTPFAALAALPPKLGIQPLLPDFLVSAATLTLKLTNYTQIKLSVSLLSLHGFVCPIKTSSRPPEDESSTTEKEPRSWLGSNLSRFPLLRQSH